MDLDRFTAAELEQLHKQIYHWGMRMCEKSEHLHRAMRVLPTWTADYRQLRQNRDALLAAATEQNELLQEIGAEMRARREAVDA